MLKLLLHPQLIRFNNENCLWIPIIWWSLSYLSWLFRGCDPFFPFVSEFATYPPESWIFFIGLNLTTLTMSIRIVQLHYSVSLRLQKLQLSTLWWWLHRLSLLPAVVLLVSVGWLAYVPWNEDIKLHMQLAMAIFQSGLLWCILATALTWKFQRHLPALGKSLRRRLVGSIITAIGLLGVTNTVAVVYEANPELLRQRIQLSLQNPIDFCTAHQLPEVVAGAAFEWLLIMGILFVSWTFNHDITPDDTASTSV